MLELKQQALNGIPSRASEGRACVSHSYVLLNRNSCGGAARSFAEYVRNDGTVRWSQPLSESWQYIKKLFEIDAPGRLALFEPAF
jgi:hypothetical protein